jgi:hypothetical protein
MRPHNGRLLRAPLRRVNCALSAATRKGTEGVPWVRGLTELRGEDVTRLPPHRPRLETLLDLPDPEFSQQHGRYRSVVYLPLGPCRLRDHELAAVSGQGAAHAKDPVLVSTFVHFSVMASPRPSPVFSSNSKRASRERVREAVKARDAASVTDCQALISRTGAYAAVARALADCGLSAEAELLDEIGLGTVMEAENCLLTSPDPGPSGRRRSLCPGRDGGLATEAVEP